MNYMAELKAFYDRLELNPLPSPAIALWHALMSIANKTGWQEEFTVAVSVLVLKSGQNAQAIKRSRNRLEQDGYITWKSRGGNQSAVYHINSLVVQNTTSFCTTNEPQNVPQCEPQAEPQCEPQSEPINKHKHKQRQKNNTPIVPIEYYQNAELNQAVLDFIESRKAKKSTMTERAIKMLIKRLDKLGKDDMEKIAILEEAIFRGWTGIFPLKNQEREAAPDAKDPVEQGGTVSDFYRQFMD